MPVYDGINWHKLVFATDWQKLGYAGILPTLMVSL